MVRPEVGVVVYDLGDIVFATLAVFISKSSIKEPGIEYLYNYRI